MSVRFIQGDCRSVLATLPDASVHCVVTSPPYWGLRDYGTAAWFGGDPACDHRAPKESGASIKQTAGQTEHPGRFSGPTCHRCGARLIDAQIGLEQSPDAYVAEMVAVFREVRRVLRDDGTCWLNLGDSYASHDPGGYRAGEFLNPGGRPPVKQGSARNRAGTYRPDGLKPKDLLMIPARVALALQADGWYLRSDIIWAKRNCMPESVRDRPTTAHEHIFLLTKQPRYFYDAVAVEEDGEIAAGTRAAKGSVERAQQANGRPPEYAVYTGKRNRRSVWWMATQPFAEAHFATFPPELAETCIKAGTSERGCCSACGAPWMRQVEKEPSDWENRKAQRAPMRSGLASAAASATYGAFKQRTSEHKGWLPSCSCNASVVPATVLDCFSGAGTTALVADRLGRNAIGVELNPEYVAMSERRLATDPWRSSGVVARQFDLLSASPVADDDGQADLWAAQ